MRNATRRNGRLRILLSSALLPIVLGSGCQSMNNTDSGLLAGGGLGALAGALIAGPRHALTEALAGGAIGAAAGGLTGAAADRSEQRAAQAAAAQQAALHNPPLSLEDIVKLTASGASDEVIITQIRTSGSVYYLNADHIVWLQNNGVRQTIIQEMQATASRVPQRVYTAVPVQPVYVVQPAPPPPVGVGVTFVRRW